jgi:3-hydroxyisobutyrate dehydrogenase
LLHSTVLPATTQTVAAAAAKLGVDLIDAPVTAVPAKFQAGEGQFLVGGTEVQVAKARDQLLLIGKSVHRFGPLGAGNVAKIAKAMINATQRVAVNEILQMATAGGLDVGQFLEFERASGAESVVARWEQVFVVEDNHARPRPVTNLFRKDVFLGEQLAHAYGLDAPVAEASARTAKVWLKTWDEAAAKKSGG